MWPEGDLGIAPVVKGLWPVVCAGAVGDGLVWACSDALPPSAIAVISITLRVSKNWGLKNVVRFMGGVLCQS